MELRRREEAEEAEAAQHAEEEVDEVSASRKRKIEELEEKKRDLEEENDRKRKELEAFHKGVARWTSRGVTQFGEPWLFQADSRWRAVPHEEIWMATYFNPRI